MYVQGDTVTLTALFVDYDGVPWDPQGVTVRVYDRQRRLVGEPITKEIDHIEPGTYQLEYTLPVGYDYLVYEFAGVDSQGKPVLARAAIAPIWTK